MSDKLQDTLNKDGISAALLTGLSKPFDCLPHVLLIAKLRAYGIELSFLRLLYSHFVQQKQEQESYSTCLEILFEVPQGYPWAFIIQHIIMRFSCIYI